MKAFVYEKYGSPDVLQLKELAKPIPAGDEILINIHAVSINGSDRESLIGKSWASMTLYISVDEPPS